METNKEEAKSNKVASKPSKTGTLTSLKSVKENLIKLGWDEQEKKLTELVTWLKKKIVDEL